MSDPLEETVEDPAPAPNAPAWVSATCGWVWSKVTTTWLGLATVITLIYILPYGLGIAAFVTQRISWGEFAILATLALIFSVFASSAPAPTPVLGTIAMILTGVLGAGFPWVAVGLVAGVTATVGFLLGYAFGLGGIGPLLAERAKRRGGKDPFRRPLEVVGRHGAKAVFVVALIPTPISSWIPVAAGWANVPFRSFMLASVPGNIVRWCAIASLGYGIAQLVG